MKKLTTTLFSFALILFFYQADYSSSLSTLSKRPVLSDFFNKDNQNELWNNHVDLAFLDKFWI